MLKKQWEPSENEVWFTNNVICGRKEISQKVSTFVEDEINEIESILADEVRYQTGVIIGEEFAIQIRKFLNLKSVGEVGKAKPFYGRWAEELRHSLRPRASLRKYKRFFQIR